MKYPLRTIKGSWKGERAQVRLFTDREAANKFLCTGSNGLVWREFNERDKTEGLPEKAGRYAWAGQRWHNVKNLDATALAHI